MLRRLLEFLNLIKPRQQHLPQTNVSGEVCELDEWDGGDETNLCDCGKGEGWCKRKQTLR